MPPNSSRAYFNPFNETNGAYKDNFFELLHKIINYWGRKGRGGQFKRDTLYIHAEIREKDRDRCTYTTVVCTFRSGLADRNSQNAPRSAPRRPISHPCIIGLTPGSWPGYVCAFTWSLLCGSYVQTTVPRKSICVWLRDISSWPCLAFMPGPA